MKQKKSEPNHGQTIARASALLRALARRPAGSRLTDLSEDTRLPKATALRLLRALASEDLAHWDETGHWRLGLGLVGLSSAASNRDGLREAAQFSLVALAEKTGDTIFLSLRDGHEIVCLDRREGAFPIKTLMLSPGDRRPLGVGAAGLAVLAFMNKEEVEASIAAVAPRLRDWPNHSVPLVWERIARSRARGFAHNDGLIMSAMHALGVPIRNVAGNVIAALSVAAITERMGEPRLSTIAGWLREEAAAIEARLIGPAERAPARSMRSRVRAR
jgi:DNA-binding IclR family transcriptional regulator